MSIASSGRASRGILEPRLYADLIGKPFRAHARGPEAFDCLGAAMEIQRRRGAQIPEYESTAEELARSVREGVLGLAVKVDDPEAGAVVLMRSMGAGADRHIGTMVDRFRMVHASEQAGSVVIETLAKSVWGRRVLGFYRCEVPE